MKEFWLLVECTQQSYQIKRNKISRDFLIVKSMAYGSKYRTARIATTETHFFVRLDIIIEIMRHFIETEW